MLSEIEVRRLYIDDVEWERTSDSWKDLKPYRNFNSFSISDESVENYYLRLKERFNIPKAVLEQWLYYVEEGASYIAYEQLPCLEKDKDHWKSHGTWRTPPVILDVKGFPHDVIPDYSDIGSGMQLIEGHSRLGYLYAIANCSLCLADTHKAYVVKCKNT